MCACIAHSMGWSSHTLRDPYASCLWGWLRTVFSLVVWGIVGFHTGTVEEPSEVYLGHTEEKKYFTLLFRSGGLLYLPGGLLFRPGGLLFRPGGLLIRPGGIAFQ